MECEMSVTTWKREMDKTLSKDEMKALTIGLSQASINVQQTKEDLIKHAKNDPALRGLLFQHDQHGSGEVASTISNWANTLSDFALAQEIVKKKIKNKDFRPEDYGIDEETFRKMENVVKNAETSPMKNVYMEPHPLVNQSRETVEEYMFNFNSCYFRVYSTVYNVRENQDYCSHWVFEDDALVMVCHFTKSEHEEDVKRRPGLQIYTDRDAMNWFATKVSRALMKNLEWDNCILWNKYVEKLLTTRLTHP